MTVFRRLYPVFIELWIAFVLVAFFVIRILGSSMGQRLVSIIKRHIGQ